MHTNPTNSQQKMDSLCFLEIVLSLICFFYFCAITNTTGIPRNWPIVGMLPGLILYIDRIHENCTDILSRTGGSFFFKGPWFTNMDMFATVEPANIHHIMTANFQNYPKGPTFLKIFDVLGDGIFNSDSDAWRIQRKMGQALLNHRRFKKFVDNTSRIKIGKGLVPVMEHIAEHGLTVDLQDIFQRFTFDTTCVLVTGNDPGCLSVDLPEVSFSKAMDEAEEAIFMRHVVPEWFWKFQRWARLGHERKMQSAWETLDRTIHEFILAKQRQMSSWTGQKENEEAADLLTSYIEMYGNETQELKFDEKFLRDTILNLMIAGRDTTSSALTWFMWLVATHKSVEEKIREEIGKIIQETGNEKTRLFTGDEINKLVYLHAAFCESLRLYPPVPFQHKEPVADDVLPSGHRVYPESKVMFSLYAMGRMPFVWGKDCCEFRPERWITERGTVRHEPSYKFLAFNAGPRTCLGKEVAFTQMKAAAAAIIHNYSVRVVEGHPVEPNVSVILYMKHGLKVKIAKRWN